ncbi:MAG TPA: LemA family protein [Candidatus Binatia bacterium]|nr:LemA family protein [Candidatus Binatia bacterium]
MKAIFTTRLPALLLATLFVLPGCGYNRLVAQGEATDAAWSEIDNQLQRRNDLVPNLVATVKGFAAHEQEVLTQVTEARSRVAGAGTPADKMAASNELSGALSRLLVVVERYPNLKADQNFLRLQDELAGTENRLAVARMRYNDAARAYNTSGKSFPTLITARLFGFEAKPYFEAPAETKAAPKVEF